MEEVPGEVAVEGVEAPSTGASGAEASGAEVGAVCGAVLAAGAQSGDLGKMN